MALPEEAAGMDLATLAAQRDAMIVKMLQGTMPLRKQRDK